jgi:hypothetical protein
LPATSSGSSFGNFDRLPAMYLSEMRLAEAAQMVSGAGSREQMDSDAPEEARRPPPRR